jgi:3-methylfumaryl-CoA hydratase
MMDNTQDFDDWLGRQEVQEPDVITPRLCREFAVTFGETLASVPGVAPGMQWCLAPQLVNTDKLGPDGHPHKGGFLPPVALPRRMWAGGVLEFYDPLLPNDAVTKTSTIKDISWKTGKSGDLCFVTVCHNYSTDRGLAISEDHNIVYREAAKVPMRRATPEPTLLKFDAEMQVTITPTMLFRYSAMTFNGHRIHYDLPYAQQTELYPDLVIHGPLQATLLLNLATSTKSTLPERFAFRSIAPATGAQTLRIGAAVSSGACELTVLSQDNVVTMTATASWDD